jgi:phosphoribosylglycinamide formyltransferase-1
VVDHRAFSDRCDFERALLATLAEHHIQIVALAGFMRLLSAVFLQNYPDRVINIHPSLLPAFPGMHAIKQALAYGVRISGCTVHLVDEGTDTGPVLLQAAVPVEPDDDEDRLAGRILAAEHRLFPAALRILAQGPLRREGRRVVTVPGD